MPVRQIRQQIAVATNKARKAVATVTTAKQAVARQVASVAKTATKKVQGGVAAVRAAKDTKIRQVAGVATAAVNKAVRTASAIETAKRDKTKRIAEVARVGVDKAQRGATAVKTAITNKASRLGDAARTIKDTATRTATTIIERKETAVRQAVDTAKGALNKKRDLAQRGKEKVKRLADAIIPDPRLAKDPRPREPVVKETYTLVINIKDPRGIVRGALDRIRGVVDPIIRKAGYSIASVGCDKNRLLIVVNKIGSIAIGALLALVIVAIRKLLLPLGVVLGTAIFVRGIVRPAVDPPPYVPYPLIEPPIIPEPEPAVKYTIIDFISTPTGAMVRTIDAEKPEWRRTPTTIRARHDKAINGYRKFEFQKEGYKSLTIRKNIKGRKRLSIHGVLTPLIPAIDPITPIIDPTPPAVRYAVVKFTSEPAGAMVRTADAAVPEWRKTPVTIRIIHGGRVFEFKKGGYKNLIVSKTITGTEMNIHGVLTPAKQPPVPEPTPQLPEDERQTLPVIPEKQRGIMIVAGIALIGVIIYGMTRK